MRRRLPFIIVIALFVTTLIIGSFFDFQINSALYNSNDWFARIMAAVGEYPGYGILAFLSGYLFCFAFKFYKKTAGMYLLILAGLAAILCAIYFQGGAITNINGFNVPHLKWCLGMPIAAAILLPLVIPGYLLAKKVENKNLWKIAVILLLGTTIAIIIINIIKPIAHRPRFRWIITQDEVTFKNWWEGVANYKEYISAGVDKDQFKSFPSGHTSTATFTLLIPYFPVLFEKYHLKKYRIPLFILSMSYVYLLAFTRMRCGAHFLSDVSMGGLISLVLLFIGNEIVFAIDKKDHQLNL